MTLDDVIAPPLGAVAPFQIRFAPCRIIFGPGRLSEIQAIAEGCKATRVAWILDSHFHAAAEHGPLGRVIGGLTATCALHAIPPGEPDRDTVEACAAFLNESDPQLIVALGGGSTMDAAKVARLMWANRTDIETVATPNAAVAPPRVPLVCVPTTAGTASEVSEMAIISETGSDVKLRVRARAAMAEVALLDPELVVSLPPAATAHTGFDAFTHAFEAYLSRRASTITDLLCLDALERLWTWLPRAFAEPENLAARGNCLIASLLAGLAFNSTELGLAHAIAAPLGAQHKVIHGLGNALALPAVTAFNEPALDDEKRAALLAIMGDRSVTEGVCRLRQSLGLDLGLDDCLPPGADQELLAQAAMKSGNVATNLRRPSLEDVRAILAAMRRPLAGALPALP